MRIVLPWPDAKLLPNNQKGKSWQYCHAAKIEAKDAAILATREAIETYGNYFLTESNIEITIYFYPPDKRGRDLDGMYSSLKPSLDAIAQVLEVNDKMFYPAHLHPCDPTSRGKVVIELDQIPF